LRNSRLFSMIPFRPCSAMFGTISHFCQKFRLACLGGLAAVVLCLATSGCSNWNLRGESYQDDNMTATIRKSRPPANKSEFWGFSNKARQIEEDFGGQ
jgi:hypothetical protein